ncbi:MAG TPA: hypothetical protein DC042_18845 [Bacteroidales bacterium]|nr:hypothetical protein [Bacteroidales bacterium]
MNLRTIQRIEKGETVPRGDSIQRLCSALEVGPEELIERQQTEDLGYFTVPHHTSKFQTFQGFCSPEAMRSKNPTRNYSLPLTSVDPKPFQKL